MTKDEFYATYNVLKGGLLKLMDKQAEHLLCSGALDLESADPLDLDIPCAVLEAAARVALSAAGATNKNRKAILRNLEHF